MKKFFGNLYIFFAVLFISLVAIPWNDFSVFGLGLGFLDILTDNEPLIKAGVVAFLFIFSLIFLLVANKEYKRDGKISKTVSFATVFPLIGVSIAFLINLAFMIYSETDLSLGIGFSNMNSILLLGSGAMILLTILFAHLFAKSFNVVGTLGRFSYLFLFLIIAVLMGGLDYYYMDYVIANYAGLDPTYVALVVPVALIIYISHIIIVHKKSQEKLDEDIMYDEDDVDEVVMGDGDLITSKASKYDGKQELYQEVKVDPEFSRQKKQRSKPNSIEYYIDKPKMFKPLNPTFDKLVNHVKDFPDVIVKSDEERITFYVARQPFLVLMNYGDYYRIAFRHELEEGIRLIIKYPTISKNKSTRDELWFKANNYGDLPKELIYKIVKNAYDLIAK